MTLLDPGEALRWTGGGPGAWLGWVAVLSNLVMAFVYIRLPFLLVVAARRRRDLPYRPQAFLIAAFILCSGIGHVLSIVVFWADSSPLLVAWNAVTAVVSAAALVRLTPAIPRVVAMRTPQELAAALAATEAALAERDDKVRRLEATEKTLRHINRDLQQAMSARKLLEARVRELEEHGAVTAGVTATQTAILKMNEALGAVAQGMTPPPDQAVSD